MVLGLGAFSAAYWSMASRQFPDWDRPTLRARVTGEAWRFDNNTLAMNFWLHPYGGALAYSLARANHNSAWGGAAYAVLTSSIWEFVLEFHEQVSVNDMIATPIAGIPFGEFLYKLGLYLDSSQNPSPWTRVAQWGAGTGVELDRVLDGRPHAVARTYGPAGFTRDIWHDFGLSFGGYATSPAYGEETLAGDIEFSGKLVTLPGYLQPGQFGKSFWQADLASFSLGVEGSPHGMGLTLGADTLFLGYHTQRMGRSRVGQAATLGASIAYRYLDSHTSGFREQLGVAHLLGPGVDWHLVGPALHLELRARAHVDFAGAGALLYQEWRADHPGVIGKHVLRIQNYFYGFGGSGELAANLSAGPVRLSGSVFWGLYDSTEGLGRWQENITEDVRARTQFIHGLASLQVEPPDSPVAVGIRSELRRWDSWVGEPSGRHHGHARALSQGFEATYRF